MDRGARIRSGCGLMLLAMAAGCASIGSHPGAPPVEVPAVATIPPPVPVEVPPQADATSPAESTSATAPDSTAADTAPAVPKTPRQAPSGRWPAPIRPT